MRIISKLESSSSTSKTQQESRQIKHTLFAHLRYRSHLWVALPFYKERGRFRPRLSCKGRHTCDCMSSSCSAPEHIAVVEQAWVDWDGVGDGKKCEVLVRGRRPASLALPSQ